MLVQCPECGHEVSDSAVKCPNCGYQLKQDRNTEVIINTIQCPECGKELPLDAKTCPNCGYVLAVNENNNETPKTETFKEKLSSMPKKTKIFAGIAVVALVVILFLTLGLGSNGRQALNDCKSLKGMLKSPSSLEIYEVFVNHDKEYGDCSFIKYGAANSYGAIIQGFAVFSDGIYLGDYNDTESDFSTQREYDIFVLTKGPYLFYQLVGSTPKAAKDNGLISVSADKLNARLK